MRTGLTIILTAAATALVMCFFGGQRYKFYESSATANFYILDSVSGNLWYGAKGRDTASRIRLEK
jgi:hypothetical protein